MNCTLFLALIQKLKQHTLFPLFVQLTLAGYSPEVLLDASYVNCCLFAGPCSLFCRLGNQITIHGVVTVADGTRCTPNASNYNICILGECMVTTKETIDVDVILYRPIHRDVIVYIFAHYHTS